MHAMPPTATPPQGRGRVLRLKEGYNPNSSSLGSIVFSFPVALAAAPVLLAGAAAWIAARLTVSAPDAAEKTAVPAERKGDAS